MDRLLTDEEREIALLGIPACGDNPERNLLQHKHATDRIAEAQDAKTTKLVRQEIGEWLRGNYTSTRRAVVEIEEVETLLRGEIP